MKNNQHSILLNTALTHHNQGKIDLADKIYVEILSQDPENYTANQLHGIALCQKTKYEDALPYLEKAYAMNQENYEVNNNLGLAHKGLRSLDISKKYFLNAIKIDSNNFRAYFNYANLLSDNELYDEAIEYFKITSEKKPDFPDPYERIGVLYRSKYMKDKSNKEILLEAIPYLEKCLEINPSFRSAIVNLALFNLWLNNIDKSTQYFKDGFSLLHSSEKFDSGQWSLQEPRALKTLIKHEYQQLTYIDNDTDGIRNMKFTQEYYNKLQEHYNDILNDNFKAEQVKPSFIKSLTKVLYNKPPKLCDDYINKKNDIDEIESIYLNGKPQLVVIDNFLNPEALSCLQKFCRSSNIFKYPYVNGYIGAFLTKGFANKFILELGEDMRKTFPKIFEDTLLSQAWAFKYDSVGKGIDVHADQATVNVNFWIAPEDGNMNKNSGGMRIWDKVPPKDATFDDYNAQKNGPKIKKMLDDYKIGSQTVTHKENRAVIFNSKLFHVTDDFEFKNTYENKRVNVTYLYD